MADHCCSIGMLGAVARMTQGEDRWMALGDEREVRISALGYELSKEGRHAHCGAGGRD